MSRYALIGTICRTAFVITPPRYFPNLSFILALKLVLSSHSRHRNSASAPIILLATRLHLHLTISPLKYSSPGHRRLSILRAFLIPAPILSAPRILSSILDLVSAPCPTPYFPCLNHLCHRNDARVAETMELPVSRTITKNTSRKDIFNIHVM